MRFALLVLLALPLVSCKHGNPPANSPPPPATTQQAVERGRMRLAQLQAADGSWGGDYQVAATSVVLLALLSNNVLDTTAQKGVGYLMSCAKQSGTGFITEPGTSRSKMHGHGFALQALSEWAMRGGKGNADVTHAIEAAVMVSERSQSPSGGWGYLPDPNAPDEVTVTVAQLQALATAKAAGVKVPDPVLARGIDYLKKCATTDKGFKYNLAGGSGTGGSKGGTVALTAGGVSSLYLLTSKDLPEIEQGLSYMAGRQHAPGAREQEKYYYLATYYATLAWSHKGGIQWNDWWGRVSSEVAARQLADGGWEGDYDPALCTSLSVLILSAPNKSLAVWKE